MIADTFWHGRPLDIVTKITIHSGYAECWRRAIPTRLTPRKLL
jgi:hypothetical protein